jgi:ATP-binding cassette subfamily F protein uup
MALLAARDLSKTHASSPLFVGLSITFEPGERVGLIGPNGGGKTTLLRILAGVETADAGTVECSKTARLAYLPQVDVFPDDDTVESALLAAVRSVELEEYEVPVRARKMLRRLGFETGEQPIETLSGGWRKRLAIVCALVRAPNLVLMDEPTNHLDLAGIEWLERFLSRSKLSFILTSHDRTFLERVANRIIEINPRYPDGFFSVNGRYSDFLERREAFLQVQDAQRQALANEVRREIEWLRRGPKARSSKAGYRIGEAHRKIDELSKAKRRHDSETELDIDFSASGRRTHDLITARGVEKSLGGRLLFRGVDAHVTPDTRLGIAGNNASGKTTLLKTLAGTLPPDDGRVRHAADLRIALFDQQRSQLDENETLRRTLAPNGDMVSYLGRASHVIAWAKRFGFAPDQLEMPVGELSGGEQARVLMAMMMREPARSDLHRPDRPTRRRPLVHLRERCAVAGSHRVQGEGVRGRRTRSKHQGRETRSRHSEEGTDLPRERGVRRHGGTYPRRRGSGRSFPGAAERSRHRRRSRTTPRRVRGPSSRPRGARSAVHPLGGTRAQVARAAAGVALDVFDPSVAQAATARTGDRSTGSAR